MANAMAYGMFLQSGASLGNAYAQSEALRMQGDYQREMSKINSRFADIYAKDASKRGDAAASERNQKAKSDVGSRRAAAAAQGISVDEGSSFDAQRDIEELSARDEQTIRNNAWREAWGFKTQASLNAGNANMQAIANQGQANMTLLTGGMQAAGSAAQGEYYRRGGKLLPTKGEG